MVALMKFGILFGYLSMCMTVLGAFNGLCPDPESSIMGRIPLRFFLAFMSPAC